MDMHIDMCTCVQYIDIQTNIHVHIKATHGLILLGL